MIYIDPNFQTKNCDFLYGSRNLNDLYKSCKQLKSDTILLFFTNKFWIVNQCKKEFPFLKIVMIFNNKNFKSLQLMQLGVDYAISYEQYKKQSILTLLQSQTACKNNSMQLSRKEQNLLEFFILNLGKPVARNIIQEVVWGYSDYIETRTIENHISHLNEKLEKQKYNNQFYCIGKISTGYRLFTI